MENETYKNYLRDLGYLLKEQALEARDSSKSKNDDYSAGYLMAFHRVISLMQQQAEAFQIPAKEICLDGIDPELDLLN